MACRLVNKGREETWAPLAAPGSRPGAHGPSRKEQDLESRKITRQFKFNLGERIRIKELDRPGIVDALGVFDCGVEYRVVYWNDGKRESVWVYAWEIEEDSR